MFRPCWGLANAFIADQGLVPLVIACRLCRGLPPAFHPDSVDHQITEHPASRRRESIARLTASRPAMIRGMDNEAVSVVSKLCGSAT